MTPSDRATIHYRDEVVRKLIHLCSLSIPVIYYFITRNEAIIILSIFTFIALLIDLSRLFFPGFGKIFLLFFGFLLRKHELDNNKKNLNGATYVLISALICVLLFPKIIFVTAFSILIISDSLAALIGRKFGRHKFLSKSLEGTLAFFLSGSVVVLLSPKIEDTLIEFLIGISAFWLTDSDGFKMLTMGIGRFFSGNMIRHILACKHACFNFSFRNSFSF